MIQVTIDGQCFPLPEDVGGKDDLLRAALAPFVPWIANARIERKEEAGNTVVSVIKRADTKGSASDVLAALVAAPQKLNPAIALWLSLQEEGRLDDPGAMVEWQPAIAEAIEAGEREIGEVRAAMEYLAECAPIPTSRIPLGF